MRKAKRVTSCVLDYHIRLSMRHGLICATVFAWNNYSRHYIFSEYFNTSLEALIFMRHKYAFFVERTSTWQLYNHEKKTQAVFNTLAFALNEYQENFLTKSQNRC